VDFGSASPGTRFGARPEALDQQTAITALRIPDQRPMLGAADLPGFVGDRRHLWATRM
jgi:hypothetical protein